VSKESQKIELKDITPRKVFNFLRSKWRKFWGIRIKEEDIIEFSEVIMYRALSCPDCVYDKACLKPEGCGCPVPQLFAAMGAECGKRPQYGAKKWFELPERGWKAAWIAHKKKKGILFSKLYTK